MPIETIENRLHGHWSVTLQDRQIHFSLSAWAFRVSESLGFSSRHALHQGFDPWHPKMAELPKYICCRFNVIAIWISTINILHRAIKLKSPGPPCLLYQSCNKVQPLIPNLTANWRNIGKHNNRALYFLLAWNDTVTVTGCICRAHLSLVFQLSTSEVSLALHGHN